MSGKQDGRSEDTAGTRSAYRAPALEKGLDILELLAGEDTPLNATAIVQRLGRSTGELFRMIQVLEQRGYVEQTSVGYTLTGQLFQLGLGRPQIRSLVEIALPEMRSLVTVIKQSCHLAFASAGEMVVVARMESQDQLGFSVRVGHRRPLHQSASGLLLYAFQPADVQREWEKEIKPRLSKTELADLCVRAEAVRNDGYLRQASTYTDGITDLSAPILRGNRAAAALTVPFVRTRAAPMVLEEVVEELRRTAAVISGKLTTGDNRL